MERMEEKIPGAKYDPLQYFLSDSNWEWQPVNNQISKDTDKLLGGKRDSALYIDLYSRKFSTVPGELKLC